MITLLNASLRVSAVLLVALALMWLLGRRTASLRHAVLVIALICAAIVPALGALLPSSPSRSFVIPVEFATIPAPEVPATTGGTVIGRQAGDVMTETPPAPGAAATEAAAMSPDLPDKASPPTMAARPAGPRFRPSVVPGMLATIYTAGLIVSLATLASGLLRLRRFAARCEPMHDPTWQRLAAGIAHTYGLARSVRLARSTRPAVLAVWGVGRPQVLLPAGAESWPEERIRAVLLHELAHVWRHDWLIQIFASTFRAAHWFNPLAWMVCARLRQESEKACDDAVIRHGVGTTDYAEHLLVLARTLVPAQSIALPAPSMARGSSLMRRVASLLDPSTSHGRVTRTSVLKVLPAMCLVTLAVAACQLVPPPGRVADIRPHQSAGASLIYRKVAPLPAPIAVEAQDPDKPPAPSIAASHADPTPRTIAAAVIEYAQSVMAGTGTDLASDYEFIRTRIPAVMRAAQRVVADDGSDPAGVPAKSTALLAALGDAANLVANILLRPGTTARDRPALSQMEAALRAKSAELGAVLLPLPAASSISASTPARRAATAVLDLTQTALADTAVVGRGQRVSLLAGLDTLDRAAKSVLTGDDSDRQATAARLTAMSTALLLTERVAANISTRDVEPAAMRSRMAALADSLRGIGRDLGLAIPPGDDTRWRGWDRPDPQRRDAVALATAAPAPGLPDRSRPPPVDASAGGFAMRRLDGPVEADGTRWLPVNTILGGQTVTAPNGWFTVSLSDPNSDGDVERYRALFSWGNGAAISLAPDVTGFAFLTEDSRWIFLEPLDVVDVKTWRRHRLGQLFGISPYVGLLAISADGKRLVVRHRKCAVDCRYAPDEYFEIQFPGSPDP